MNRINERFRELKAAGSKGFIPYITAGFPDMAATEELIRRLDAMEGIAAIEIGIPFSDPIGEPQGARGRGDAQEDTQHA